MGLFSMFSGSSKEAEIEQLINKTMKATHAWEISGEKSGGQEIMDAATSIRLNATKIIDLYCDLVKTKGSRNLYVRNKTLPHSMPKEIAVYGAIMTIIDTASRLATKNPSFINALIDQSAISRLSRL